MEKDYLTCRRSPIPELHIRTMIRVSLQGKHVPLVSHCWWPLWWLCLLLKTHSGGTF